MSIISTKDFKNTNDISGIVTINNIDQALDEAEREVKEVKEGATTISVTEAKKKLDYKYYVDFNELKKA